MKILGMDSSGLVASVAVVENDILVAEYTVNHKKTHSQTLLPMLDEVVRMTELDLDSIDAIAVAAGPGSFTGLRIGAATVKALGFALDKPVVSVPTCHGLAYNMWGTDKLVCPIMDARRNQVYTGVYEFVEGKLVVIRDQDAMSIDELLDYLNTLDRRVIFVGDGIPVYGALIKERLNAGCEFAPAGFNRQRASSVAAIGLQLYESGHFQNADDHKPIYLRKSQAEREREEQMKKEG